MITSLFKNIFKDNVFKIVLVLFIGLSFFKRPNLHDVDINTIIILFNLMLIIEIVKETNILNYFSNVIINHVTNSRQIIAWITFFSFFGSMLVTNDVAIITLVPLYIIIANQYHLNIAYPVTLITIAANLGSSVSPIGNPQNIFLVEYYRLKIQSFIMQSFQLLVLGTIIMIVLIMFNKKEMIVSKSTQSINIKKMDVMWVAFLFILVLLAQFHFINMIIPSIFVIIKAARQKRQLLYHIDYALLLTFIGFFLIVGMIDRTLWVTQSIKYFTEAPKDIFLISVGISQIISNVPGAVLISQFSHCFDAIYWGVSIGGLGTLVASLANLLAFKQVAIYSSNNKFNFLKIFTIINTFLLIILIIIKIILI